MDLTMRVSLLAAPYIIKGFVQGERNCNYEIYLLELLNRSKWFSAAHPGRFEKPASEANGECDANNPNYQIDFKLFASKTALQARSLLSFQVSKETDGVTIWSRSKKSGPLQMTRIFAAFRRKTYDELCAIHETKAKARGIENDMLAILKNLETEKNLLLFFPYIFSFDVPHSQEEAVESIREGLTEDFHVAFEYRYKKTRGLFDTFMTCIYNHTFLLFAVKEYALEFIDAIRIDEIKSFVRLSNYDHSDFINNVDF